MNNSHQLRLFEDRLGADAKAVYLPRGTRALYVVSGAVEVVFYERTQWVSEGHGVSGDGQATLQVDAAFDPDGAVIWRWELVEISEDLTEEDFVLRSAPAAGCELKLDAEIALDARYEWLMRLDTVTFPPGGVALTHMHQGPGIRITRNGEITIETEGESRVHGPGDPWLERGVFPVLAPTTESESTTFVRCFMLPVQCRGVSSIRIVRPEDRSKPNTQSYRILAEHPIRHD